MVARKAAKNQNAFETRSNLFDGTTQPVLLTSDGKKAAASISKSFVKKSLDQSSSPGFTTVTSWIGTWNKNAALDDRPSPVSTGTVVLTTKP